MAKSNLKSLTKMMSLNKLQKKIMFLLKPKNLYKVLILLLVLGILYFIRHHFLAKEGFASSAEDFEETISGKKALVLFHADWCGHCKKFMPEWDEISNEAAERTDDTILVKVDCGDSSNNEKHAEIMKKYSIKGYPTILSFDESGKSTEYDGDRSKTGIFQLLGLSA